MRVIFAVGKRDTSAADQWTWTAETLTLNVLLGKTPTP